VLLNINEYFEFPKNYNINEYFCMVENTVITSKHTVVCVCVLPYSCSLKAFGLPYVCNANYAHGRLYRTDQDW